MIKKGRSRMNYAWRCSVTISCLFSLFSIINGCGNSAPSRTQGYVEGEYVYVASSAAGTLETLAVHKGAQVKAGDDLFSLDLAPEKATRDEARERLSQARANLEDAKKGKRPTEIASLEAQLKQARVAQELSKIEFMRQEKMFLKKATSVQDVDRARSVRDQDRQRVAQIESDVKTARLGSRQDQIAAAQANVSAMEDALARAEWDLAQKRMTAPKAGQIIDTFYREGEWVAAGHPVVALLPPQNIKVRTFVSETKVGTIRYGDHVNVFIDGVAHPFLGKVSFISPQAEYTPPVIYSRENRSKLVFMVEAVFDPQTAVKLHPGQPVDVQFGK